MSFDFFDDHAPSKQNNLEQVVNNFVNGDSFQFDQFDNVDQNKADHSKSFNSDFFNTGPKQEQPAMDKGVSAKSQGKNQSFDFDNSRHLSQISYMNGQSFHYQQPAPPRQHKPNDRYNKLQQMLSQAKNNNLDMFYRNIDQQNTYKNEDMFNNKQEFNQYRSNLKNYKRQLENDFKGKQGNYNFRNNNYHIPEKDDKDSDNPFSQTEPMNFKKKSNPGSQKNQEQVDFFGGGNLLPQEYQKQDDGGFDFFVMEEQEIKREVDKYQKKQYQKEAQQFFTEDGQKQQNNRIKSTRQLSQIREQRPNLFELTHEEQKMTTLLQNYQEMKNNFNDLMKNLKHTNTDQQKIINELKNIKQQYESKQSRIKINHQNKQQKRQLREKEKEQKQKKMAQIKEQIQRAKEGGEKDIMFVKINEKIESLQSIVRNAITEMNTEKEQKFVPKIINYYHEEEPPRTSRSRTNRSQLGLSREEGQNSQDISRSREQIQGLEDQLAPVRSMINELKEDRTKQMLYKLDQFNSPLQLDLTTQQFPMDLSRDRSQQFDVAFIPPEGAKHYIPNALDPSKKYLRRCLTQKSSIIYESFQFYVTGKFLMTGAERSPVVCQVRIANKCAVSLYDVLVIVFGPQAQESELQMRPAKVMYDEFRQNTSFLFEVDLSKICLESGGFNIMISYKTDSVNKKKVVFKVVLPFVQLIKPEFIYEEQFTSGWNHMSNELYVNPQTLDFKTIRSHEDLKLLLPLIEISERDPNAFAYGIMFHYPTSSTVFMLKIVCYVNGRASLHLKSSALTSGDKRLREQILDIINFLCFG